MSTENRDWYRDWWRKKTDYTERASFRVSASEFERRKHRAQWRRSAGIVAAGLLSLVLALVAVKNFLL